MRLLIVVGLSIVAVSLWTALTGRAMFAGEGVSPYLTLGALPQLDEVTSRGGAVIRVIDLPLWVRLLAYASGVLTGIVTVLVALATTRMLIAIAAARPFDSSTAQRVRRVGLLLAAGGLLVGGTDTVASVIFSRSTFGGLTDDWQTAYTGLGFTMGDWPWSLIVTGVVVIAAAPAFSEGERLQEEVDGVI